MQNAPTPHVELTIQALVAIMSATYRSPSGGNRRQSELFSSPWEIGIGISNDAATNNRFCRVLDAFASLCVSRPKAQVFSIGFQFNHQFSQLHITIADNSEVEQYTVDYFAKVWSLLKKISDEYARNRLKHGHASGTPWSGTSPKIPPVKKVEVLKWDLVKLICTFTKAKHNKRIRKWWDPDHQNGLLNFAYRFSEKKGQQPPGIEGTFETMLLLLREAIQQLHAQKTDWVNVTKSMGKATALSKTILDHPNQCEDWADEFSDESGAFPLRRSIEKLISHHNYINELIAFAHSPRLRVAFEFEMFVHTVPAISIPGNVSLPTTSETWGSLLREVCHAGGRPLQDVPPVSVVEKLLNFYNKPNHKHRVHSECSLVAHYEAMRTNPDGHKYLPAFNYIGVSKLSCKPCEMWLAAFNARGGLRFHTRGTHNKWYFPWSPPPIPGWSPPLLENMCKVYAKHLERQGLLRSASDSTTASGGVEYEEEEEVDEIVARQLAEGFRRP